MKARLSIAGALVAATALLGASTPAHAVVGAYVEGANAGTGMIVRGQDFTVVSALSHTFTITQGALTLTPVSQRKIVGAVPALWQTTFDKTDTARLSTQTLGTLGFADLNTSEGSTLGTLAVISVPST